MNFTEISELNEILSHCRSFHPVSSYSLNTSPFEHHQNTQKDLNFISVDELISSSFIDITPINSRINYEKMSYGDDNDNIEKIIADINKFLYIDGKEISRRRSNDRSKEGILISASLQELNNVRMDFSAPKQAFRYKRSVTFEVEDDDNPFSPKKGKNTGETKKVSIDMLINECEKKDESDKSEKTKDFDTQNKQITLPNVVRCVKKLQTENITRNFTRKNTITFLSESVKQNFFYKLDESFFINIFLKKIRSKSLLSENLSNKYGVASNYLIENPNIKSNFKEITVFFFSTPSKLKIPINVNRTVNEVIKIIINFYMISDEVDHTLMKFPNHIEAYELRCLEDDDDYKPEMSFDPLAGNRNFNEYNIDSLAFCETYNFIPGSNRERSINQIYSREKEKKMEEILAKRLKNVVQINIIGENYSTMIPVEPNSLIKDIYPILQRKLKVNPRKYIVRSLNFDDCEYDSNDQEEEINLDMPLKKLKTNKLQLVKKIYADDPEPNFIEMINNVNQNEIFSYEAESLEDSKHLLNPLYIEMNQTLAASYEEFEIIKIKKNGEKQLRILGINKFRIFNKYRERHEGGLLNFLNIFASNKRTKYPERLIESIQDIDYIQGSDIQIYIDFLEWNNKLKRIVYEGTKKNILYIMTKLSYLMKKKIKRRNRIKREEHCAFQF